MNEIKIYLIEQINYLLVLKINYFKFIRIIVYKNIWFAIKKYWNSIYLTNKKQFAFNFDLKDRVYYTPYLLINWNQIRGISLLMIKLNKYSN